MLVERGCKDGTARVGSRAFPIFFFSARRNSRARGRPASARRQFAPLHQDQDQDRRSSAAISTVHYKVGTLSVHCIACIPLPARTTKAAACSLSSVSATFGPITQATPFHAAGQPAVTTRRERATSVGYRGGHDGKGRGSCHLYGSADPSYRISHAVRHWCPLAVQLVITWQGHSKAHRFHSPQNTAERKHPTAVDCCKMCMRH